MLLREELQPSTPTRSVCEPHRVAAAERSLLPDTAYAALADTFRALSDPTRARIVHLLADHALCVGDIAYLAAISQPAASQHLKLLKTLNVVRGERHGKLVRYTLADDHVRALLAMAVRHQAHASPGTPLS